MRRAVPALLLAAFVLAAGCVAGGPGTSPTSPSTMTTASSGSTTPTAGAAVPVEYVVRPGTVPDEFQSVEVTLRVVFVETPGDLGPCYPDIFRGPYKPTLTPLQTPAGECHRSQVVTVDLADLEGDHSLGTFTAPGSVQGHALLVVDVRATLENGTVVERIRGIGGVEAIRSPARPSGTVVARIGLEPAPEDADYDYTLVAEPVDGSE